jgi:hypothetical protein
MSALQWIEVAVVALIVGGAVSYLVAYVRDVIRFGSSSSGPGCGGGCPSCGPDKDGNSN